MKLLRKKTKKNNRGAITAFLIIILVPCIVFVSIFTDLARVQLSKSKTSSTADLSMYTVLSHYDADLKELYGLMASEQKMDSYIKAAEEYFRVMATGSDVNDYKSTFAWDYLKDVFSDGGEIINFLKTELTDDVSISKMANGDLANAALLEDGIVEFMKYRGVITLVTKLIERFSSLNFDKAEDAKKYEKVSKAKDEFSKAEAEFLRDAFYTYFAMEQYQQVMHEYSYTVGYPNSRDFYKHYEDFKNDLQNIWDDLEQATILITKYYACTSGIRNMNFRPDYTTSLNEEYYNDYLSKFARQDEDDEEKWYLSNEAYHGLVKDFDDAYKKVTDIVSEIATGISEVPSGDNAAVYMMRVQNRLGDADTRLYSAMADLQKYTYWVIAATKCESDPEEPIGDPRDPELAVEYKQRLADLISEKASNITSNYGSSDFVNQTDKYYKCSPRETAASVIGGEYKFDSKFLNESVSLAQFSGRIASRLQQETDYIDKQLGNLKTIIEGGRLENGSKVKKIHKLKDEAKEYKKTLDNWESEAEKIATTPSENGQEEKTSGEQAADDLIEINEKRNGTSPSQEEVVGRELADGISEQRVSEMETRLKNIRKDLESLKKSIESLTYGGKKLTQLTIHNDYVKAALSVIPSDPNKISIDMDECTEQGKNYASQLIKPASKDQIYSAPPATVEHNPDLEVAEPGQSNLYLVLKKAFEGQSLEETDKQVKENDKRNDKYKKEAEELKKNTLKYDTYMYDFNSDAKLPSATANTIGSSGLETIKALASVINKLLTGDTDEFRDHIYVVEYIMDMFTYATYANESWYARANKETREFGAKQFDQVRNDHREGFKTLDLYEHSDNITLTNVLRDQNHNEMYLGEVEYILFGKPTIAENISTSLTAIFAIRLALNTVSGFMNFYNNTSAGNKVAAAISKIAGLISTLSHGIIPPILTKSVLIGILAIRETCKDVDYLKRGVPVTLYKATYKDWSCQLNNEPGSPIATFSDGSDSDEIGPPEDPNGLYYSDYMYIFLLMSTETYYDALLKRTGNVIEANMKKVFNKPFSLNNANVYYQLKAKVKVKPLMITLPLVRSFDPGVEGLIESDNWCTYVLDFMRGYS